MKIGSYLRRERRYKDVTQEALADMSGVSISYLKNVELNKQEPGLKTIFKICNALDIDPCDAVAVAWEDWQEDAH